jgi:hypothetical protein
MSRPQHVNLDYGRRGRLLPRDKQPFCGCDECIELLASRYVNHSTTGKGSAPTASPSPERENENVGPGDTQKN